LAELFQRLGIANRFEQDQTAASGAQIAELLSRGEVELGFSADLNCSTPAESISIPYRPGCRASRSGQVACPRRRRGGEPHIPEHARVVGLGERDPKAGMDPM
jgi:hypothetical protein